MKTCRKCGEAKDSSEFYAGRAQCKDCKRAYQRDRDETHLGMDLTKRCRGCGEELPIEDFEYVVERTRKPRYRARCRPCLAKEMRERRAAEPEKHKRALRRAYVKREYGITLEEYDELLKNGCEICGSHDSMHLDHCHETGKLRGGLCAKCNRGLGMFNENAYAVYAAFEYLELHEPTGR